MGVGTGNLVPRQREKTLFFFTWPGYEARERGRAHKQSK